MSSVELKQVAQSLTLEERIELRAYLRLHDLAEDNARKAELFGRAKTGDFIDQDEVRRRLEKSAGFRS